MALEIAVNLYSARAEMEQDLEGTLGAIARAGYRNVELAGYHGRDPQAFKGALDANGLRAFSSHVPIDRFERELEVVIGEARLLGLEALVVPWLSPEQRTPEFLDDLPVKLNAWGEKVVENRMRFAYHNHDFEYEIVLNDRSLMEILLADTHAEFVDLEPDLYFIAGAGLDPARELLEMHPRVRLIHVKDRAADGSVPSIGRGTLDWDAILDAADRIMAEYLIVELHQPNDAIAQLEESYRFLSERLATG